MSTVELIWRRGCPNVSHARANLMRALSLANVPLRWQERCLNDDDCPAHARVFASPTVLVNGADVASAVGGEVSGCRVYSAPDGQPIGAPPVALIARALRPERSTDRPSWRRHLSFVPSVAVALLPKLGCPACWPAYASLLSSFGVSFLIDTRYLLGLTALFLAITLFFLGFRAQRRRGYGPLLLGTIASAVLLIGKFVYETDAVLFVGVGLLMAASLWNSWPRKLAASCSACEPDV